MMVFDAGPAGGAAASASQASVSPPRLSAVIVNHHRPDLLADALRALYASTRRPDEIVVVEADAAAAADAAEEPSIPEDDREPAVPLRLLLMPDNPGYAAACNRGAAQASGDWLLFMNADVNVSPECLGAVLAEASADSGVGIATCRLRTGSRRSRSGSCCCRTTPAMRPPATAARPRPRATGCSS